MANLAVRRIAADMKNYLNSNLDECGIYCKFNEENIFNVKALIIGPEDTPYENGFHLFNIDYPKNYPLQPPKVTFISTDSRIRANPNLYTNGKVCLSILGTWSGPGWTSCLTLNTVLLSIQSLLNSNPVQNEPGYENDTSERSIIYKNVVNYYNIEVSTIKYLNNIPYGYEYFLDIMKEHFYKKYESYLKQLDFHKNTLSYKYCIYGLKATINYAKIKKELDSIYTNLKNDEKFMKKINISKSNTDQHSEDGKKNNLINKTESESNTETINNEINNNLKKKEDKQKKRKCPNKKAKEFDLNYEMISENDGRNYKVSETKAGIKRWILSN